MKGRKRVESSDRDAAERVRLAQARVHETADRREEPGGLERWHAALFELDQAMRQLYPPTFTSDVGRLRDGDPGAIETAIRFLEADPYAFGTGYAKEEILRRLRRLDLKAKQKVRLREVILHQVDQGDRREFRQYCLLAPTLVDDKLRTGLRARLRSGDPGRSRRALWVLDALREPLDHGDRAIALGVIEALAASNRAWESVEWLRLAINRHGDVAWLDEMTTRATVPGKAGHAAALLVGLVGRRLTSEQRQRLETKFEADVEQKLAAVRMAAAHRFPTGDIEVLASDIEDAYGSTNDG